MLQGIILVEPKHHANVGAIARSIVCFGFSNLILVNPPKHLRLDKAAAVSEQGKEVISQASKVGRLQDVTGTKIATISRHDNGKYGLPLTVLKDATWPQDFYLVMGREATGLHEDELRNCDGFVTIPTNGKRGVLNLAQATTIVLYELSKQFGRY